MSWIDFIGYAACACVLATFCMSTMVPLRMVAICSNVLFVTFGALAHIYPVLVLHVVLLPVNTVRLLQALVPTKEGLAGGTGAPALYFGTSKINNNFDVVDAIGKADEGMTATLFAKGGDEYIRVSTSVPKPDGSARASRARATGEASYFL